MQPRHPLGPMIHFDLPLMLATAPASIPEPYTLRAELRKRLEVRLGRRLTLIQVQADYDKSTLAAAR